MFCNHIQSIELYVCQVITPHPTKPYGLCNKQIRSAPTKHYTDQPVKSLSYTKARAKIVAIPLSNTSGQKENHQSFVSMAKVMYFLLFCCSGLSKFLCFTL